MASIPKQEISIDAFKLVPLTHPMIWSIQLQLRSFLELTTDSESLPSGSSPRLNHRLIVYALLHCNLACPTFYMASMSRTHMCILWLGFCDCETETWDSVRNSNTQQWRRKLEMVSKAAFGFRWSQFSVKNLHLIGQTNSWTLLQQQNSFWQLSWCINDENPHWH